MNPGAAGVVCSVVRVLWSIGSLPELQAFDPEDRRLLLRRAGGWRATGDLLMRTGALALLVAALAWIGTRTPALAVVAGLAIAATYYQVRLHRIRASLQRTLLRLAAGERLPVCLGCGHDLTGSAGARCPECGAPAVAPPRAADA